MTEIRTPVPRVAYAVPIFVLLFVAILRGREIVGFGVLRANQNLRLDPHILVCVHRREIKMKPSPWTGVDKTFVTPVDPIMRAPRTRMRAHTRAHACTRQGVRGLGGPPNLLATQQHSTDTPTHVESGEMAQLVKVLGRW